MEKKALLILVHGTPRPAANRDLYAVIERLKQRPDAAQKFPIVEIGFMECNEPTIPEAIALCIAAGAQSVVAVPYFLHTGTHVADDLPSLLEQAQRDNPTVRFSMGTYIGLSPHMADLLAKRASEAEIA